MNKETNKASATGFLRLVAAGEVDEAYRLYIGARFRHHNPYFPGDAEALKAAMQENALANPNKVLEIQHALEEGDRVAVHSRIRQTPDDRGFAVVHIFRFEDGRIAESWDVGQAVPEDSPNAHGMF